MTRENIITDIDQINVDRYVYNRHHPIVAYDFWLYIYLFK